MTTFHITDGPTTADATAATDEATTAAASLATERLLRRRLARRGGDEGTAPAGVVPRRSGRAPLSPGQEAMWLAERLDPGAAANNYCFVNRLRGRLDPAALNQALTEVHRRHEVLRTIFGWSDGEAVQAVQPVEPVLAGVVDLSGHPDPLARAYELARDLRDRPYRLDGEPGVRWQLMALGTDDHVLVQCMHHVVADGWSEAVLNRELSTLYADFRAGGRSTLPELTVQYGDVAAWQRERLADGSLLPQLTYWHDQLAGAPAVLRLPVDRPAPAAGDASGATLTRGIPAHLVEALARLGQAEGASLFMVLAAAFATLLSRYSGQEELVIGTPIAGRNRPEFESLVGFFVNTVALRVDLSGRPTFRELLRRVREVTLDAYTNQEVPFERVVADLRPDREPGRQPLVQARIQLHNPPEESLDLAGLRVTREQLMVDAAGLDLSLSLIPDGSELRGYWQYRTALLDDSTVERMQGHFAALLESVVVGADVAVSELGLLGGDERRWLVELAAGAVVEVGDGCALPGWFEERVRLCPDAVAVVCGGEVVSFGELNVRANRLAWWLRSRGVGAESLVGLFLDRGVELVVAVLGVLKAGVRMCRWIRGIRAESGGVHGGGFAAGGGVDPGGVVDRLPVGVVG
ncbi:hypothetical protein DMB66_58800, partial [Actinoplanes sp. ATCC 53533]|uniref:condensation domain-containing protein n=1 Tax=Actinoplanes sp. ATCC 53533 TaxID=1288362 RepID=UPI001001D4D1